MEGSTQVGGHCSPCSRSLNLPAARGKNREPDLRQSALPRHIASRAVGVASGVSHVNQVLSITNEGVAEWSQEFGCLGLRVPGGAGGLGGREDGQVEGHVRASERRQKSHHILYIYCSSQMNNYLWGEQ